jgi:hypothetical protein
MARHRLNAVPSGYRESVNGSYSSIAYQTDQADLAAFVASGGS